MSDLITPNNKPAFYRESNSLCGEQECLRNFEMNYEFKIELSTQLNALLLHPVGNSKVLENMKGILCS